MAFKFEIEEFFVEPQPGSRRRRPLRSHRLRLVSGRTPRGTFVSPGLEQKPVMELEATA